MQEIAISCSCCGWMLTMEEDAAVCLCPACGTTNARPVSTGSTLEALTRAVRQRAARDFHEAEISYQQVLLQNPDEHEALWGRLLCRYGVEYVEDPATHRRLPTVHSVQRKPMQEQADFRDACEYAPPEVAARYRWEAAYIDHAQAEIRRLAETCPPYDVFLCHKTTKPGSGEKTDDFHRAYQLYHYLRDQGVRAFFAPECMTDVAGADYEAGIYNALETAKVMLVVCSDASYITSPWVRSEWTRFLALADERGDKRLIPLLYDHFSPSKLPQQFRARRLQGVDMTELNAATMMLDAVIRILGRETVQEETVRKVAGQKDTAPEEPNQPPVEYTIPKDQVIIEMPRPNPNWTKIKHVELVTGKGKPMPVEWLEQYPVGLQKPGVFFVMTRRTKNRKKVIVAFLLSVLITLLNLGFYLTDTGWWAHGTDPELFGSGLCLSFYCMLLSIVATMVFALLLKSELGYEYLHFPVIPGKRYQLDWEPQPSGKYRLVCEKLDS